MSDKFVCLYILKITMNEWKSIYRKKKNIFQQTNYNLFAFGVGCVIALTLFTYSKAQYNNYELPTGNNYAVSSTWKFESVKEVNSWEHKPITIKNQWTWRSENVVAWTRKIESWWNWSVEKVNQRWTEPILRVKGFDYDTDATKIINYAYKISGGDMDFILTLKAENWGFNMYQQSNVVKNWIREDSRWLCQLNRKRHKEVDTKEFWESWEYQVEICYKKYAWWTKFYGYNVRNRYKDQFYWE